VKAEPRCLANPKGVKSHEGIGSFVGLNRRLATTDRSLDQRPEGDGAALATRSLLLARHDTETTRGHGRAMSPKRLGSGENP